MLVWLDLETTGIPPKEGSILEIAMIATDDNLVEIGEPFVSLVQPLHLRGWEVMDDFVKDMHTKSGLLDRLYVVAALSRGNSPTSCLLPSLPRCGDVEHKAINWLQYIGSLSGVTDKKEFRSVPLAGNTVHFDKRWLIEHMDALEALFSHRIFDVSVLTEFAKRYAPAVYAGRPGLGPDGKPVPKHRALDDIRNSIETARYYRDKFGERTT